MAGERRRLRPYVLFGRTVNAPEAVARVKSGPLNAPGICRYCKGEVKLVNNAEFYKGREYGWPLAYYCSSCGARVGCHPGTDIPLGSLADAVESDSEWLHRFLNYGRPWHELRKVDSYLDLPEYREPWGMAFVDHG